jgi:trk system potassium uptake protein TrkH
MKFRKSLNKFFNFLIGLSLLIVVLVLILEYGFYFFVYRFYFHLIEYLTAAFLNLLILFKFLLSKQKFSFIKNNRGYLILIFLYLTLISLTKKFGLPKFFIDFLYRFPKTSPEIFFLQLYLFFFLCLISANINRLISHFKKTFLRLLIFIPTTFILIILIGTLLLLLPRAVSPNQKTSFIDALFTATSAVCVTGLTVYDLSTHFSRLGQLVILFLIQIGGLGIITFTTLFSLILGREISLKEKIFLSKATGTSEWFHIGRLIVKIFIFVFLIETLGAFLLYFAFLPYFGPLIHNFYLSLFHSISAFNNAGFTLFKNSLAAFQKNFAVNLIISGLIILGGLGFPVLFELFSFFLKPKEKRKLSLHTKVVLTTTFILIFFGTFLIFLLENKRLNDLKFSEKLLVSYFQSVTSRTAGFSTLPIKNLLPITSLVIIFLMFIGASPGSTGGGIKTTTFAVIITTLKSWLKGCFSIQLFKRSLNPVIIRSAFLLFFLAIFWIFFTVCLLTLTEKQNLLDIFFEVVSAFSTVGLSKGITTNLTSFGKLIIIFTMFLGRIGPLILSIYLTERGISEHFKYPEDKIIIS